MLSVTFGLKWSIALENNNGIFTTYTVNNEDQIHRQSLSFKQNSSLASSDKLKVNTNMKTLFTFKILFYLFYWPRLNLQLSLLASYFFYLSLTSICYDTRKLSADKHSRKNTYPCCHLEFNRSVLYTSVKTRKYLLYMGNINIDIRIKHVIFVDFFFVFGYRMALC